MSIVQITKYNSQCPALANDYGTTPLKHIRSIMMTPYTLSYNSFNIFLIKAVRFEQKKHQS